MRKRPTIDTGESVLKAPRLLEKELLDDGTTKNAVEDVVSKNEFLGDLKKAFAKLKKIANLDNLVIVKMSEAGEIKGVNSSSNFIASYNDEKYHIKAALHGSGISLGTKYNEIAHYKINEALGIGPRCEGIVTEEGLLMIVTEDLSKRSIGGREGKEISFKDNEGERGDNGKAKKDPIVDEIPERHQDNVHRCATEIAINLLFYTDVSRNYGNTGFKTTFVTNEDGSVVQKEKAFIIDFRLANYEDWSMKYYIPKSKDDKDGHFFCEIIPSAEIRKYAEIIGSRLQGDVSVPLPKDVFNFKEDPEVFRDTIRKLFISENGESNKFIEVINKSFEYARNLTQQVKDPEQREKHLEALRQQEGAKLLYARTFLEESKIKSFLEQEKMAIQSRNSGGAHLPSGLISEASSASSAENKSILEY